MKYLKQGKLCTVLEEIETVLERYNLSLRITYPNCIALVDSDGREFQIKNIENGEEVCELPRTFDTEHIILEDENG